VVEVEEDGRLYHFQRSWIRYKLRDPGGSAHHHVEGESMMPTLHHGDIVLVNLARRAPTPPGVSVLHEAWGWSPSGSTISPISDPPRVRIISDNPLYSPYEGTAEEVNIIGRIRWFAREI
jgi:phage repressor protein C with HTH and peptisase S24 domain